MEEPAARICITLEFIPIAEYSGIINEIGEWIMRTACRQFIAWQNQSVNMPLIVAINISGVQLLQADFVERIRGIFAEEDGRSLPFRAGSDGNFCDRKL